MLKIKHRFSKIHGTSNFGEKKKKSTRRDCNSDWGRNPNQTKYFLHKFCLNFQWTLWIPVTKGTGESRVGFNKKKKKKVDIQEAHHKVTWHKE